MKQHAQRHTAQPIKCLKCPLTFKTKAEFNQHYKGHHGDGYVLPCGIQKQWPREVARHKKQCADCKNIMLKQRKKEMVIAAKILKAKK